MTPSMKLTAAARILGYHYKTILNYVHAGTLHAVRGPGGQFRITEAEIERFQTKRLSGQDRPSLDSSVM
ncbi:MAG: helix-turn-helix domain-containing protein [Candidatus Aminicenantales bacterium]